MILLTVGDIPRRDRHELQCILDTQHANQTLQAECREIVRNEAEYLVPENTKEQGSGLIAKIDIPAAGPPASASLFMPAGLASREHKLRQLRPPWGRCKCLTTLARLMLTLARQAWSAKQATDTIGGLGCILLAHFNESTVHSSKQFARSERGVLCWCCWGGALRTPPSLSICASAVSSETGDQF